MNDPNYYAEEYNSVEKEPKKIRILDSTLREGEQHPGVAFTVKERIQIAWDLPAHLPSTGLDLPLLPLLAPADEQHY